MCRESLYHLRDTAGSHQNRKITPLQGRVANDDVCRASLRDVVEHSLYNASMGHQAIQALTGGVVVMHPVGLYHNLGPFRDNRA
jgi:hypothetical protein